MTGQFLHLEDLQAEPSKADARTLSRDQGNKGRFSVALWIRVIPAAGEVPSGLDVRVSGVIGHRD